VRCFAIAASTIVAMASVATPKVQETQPHVDTRLDGSHYMSAEIKQLQIDDAQNPGMLWVATGKAAWVKAELTNKSANKSCESCHSADQTFIKSAATRYPMAVQGKVVTLSARINQCRIEQQQQPAFAFESAALLGLETYLTHLARHEAIVPASPSNDSSALYARAKTLWQQRVGQLNLSCQNCHDELAGKRLSGSLIPQAHPTNYPTYRLEWQTLGSLQRRLRNCMTGVRAEPYTYGSQEFALLEWYLKDRARGMLLDAPGVRP
jgi:L-cysteine S-thiosulfotransferase